MRIAICDDETAQQQLLSKYLHEWGASRGIPIEIAAFPDGESLLFAWEEDKAFELLILDIEMRKINGMELAQMIRKTDELVPILFVTGYDQYMAQGYEVSALHYLLKPINTDKLFHVLDRLQNSVRTEKKLLFKTDEAALSIPAAKIWYFEACAHQCMLYTADEKYEIKQSITALEKYLTENGNMGTSSFVRCHRSYIVNLQHISTIVKNELILDNGIRLPVSRHTCKAVNEAFIKLHTRI